LAGLTLAAFACGDDGDGSSAGQGGSTSQGGSGGEGAAGGAGPAGSTLRVAFVQRGNATPLAGAPCALMAPGGQKLDATTDESGLAVFDGLDWSLGAASITCLRGARYAESFVGFTEADAPGGIFTLRAWSTTDHYAPQDPVTVTGLGLNRSTPSLGYYLSATNSASALSTFSGPFSLEVARSEPFTLLGAAYVSFDETPQSLQSELEWTLSSSGPLEDDATLDLDFAAAVTPEVTSGSIALPDEDVDAFMPPFIWITSQSQPLLRYAGFSTRIVVDPDAQRIEYDVEFLDVLEGDEVTLLQSYTPDFLQGMQWAVLGPPPSGAQTDGLLHGPPVVTSPTSPVALEGADIAWEPSAWPHHGFWVYSSDFSVQWNIETSSDATSLVVPQLPTGISAADFFGEATVYGDVQAFDELLLEDVPMAAHAAYTSVELVP